MTDFNYTTFDAVRFTRKGDILTYEKEARLITQHNLEMVGDKIKLTPKNAHYPMGLPDGGIDLWAIRLGWDVASDELLRHMPSLELGLIRAAEFKAISIGTSNLMAISGYTAFIIKKQGDAQFILKYNLYHSETEKVVSLDKLGIIGKYNLSAIAASDKFIYPIFIAVGRDDTFTEIYAVDQKLESASLVCTTNCNVDVINPFEKVKHSDEIGFIWASSLPDQSIGRINLEEKYRRDENGNAVSYYSASNRIEVESPYAYIEDVALSDDGELLAIAYYKRGIVFMNAKTLEIIPEIEED